MGADLPLLRWRLQQRSLLCLEPGYLSLGPADPRLDQVDQGIPAAVQAVRGMLQQEAAWLSHSSCFEAVAAGSDSQQACACMSGTGSGKQQILQHARDKYSAASLVLQSSLAAQPFCMAPSLSCQLLQGMQRGQPQAGAGQPQQQEPWQQQAAVAHAGNELPCVDLPSSLGPPLHVSLHTGHFSGQPMVSVWPLMHAVCVIRAAVLPLAAGDIVCPCADLQPSLPARRTGTSVFLQAFRVHVQVCLEVADGVAAWVPESCPHAHELQWHWLEYLAFSR